MPSGKGDLRGVYALAKGITRKLTLMRSVKKFIDVHANCLRPTRVLDTDLKLAHVGWQCNIESCTAQ